MLILDMQKLWLTAVILLICCSRQPDHSLNSTKTDYKKNKQDVYSDIFKAKKEHEEHKSTEKSVTTPPPLSSFNSQPIESQSENDKESSGFFSFLFWDSKEEILLEKRTAVCNELLDINKIVVVDQNKKLIDLSIDKDNMVQKINSLEENIKKLHRTENERIKELESEVDRLNWLVKVLSSEIR